MTEDEREELVSLIQAEQSLQSALAIVRKRRATLEPSTEHVRPYRIAIRPDERDADPMSSDTLCDDIVVNNVSMFRAEQMNTKNWWVGCYLNDDTHDRICWSVTARSNPLRLEWVTTEFPQDETVYEHDAERAQ